MTKNINRIEKHRQGTSTDGNQLDGLANAELKKRNVTIDYLVGGTVGGAVGGSLAGPKGAAIGAGVGALGSAAAYGATCWW